MKIVSACLAGEKCRFDGTAKPCQKVIEMVERGEAISICPEVLGGLPTPRPNCEQKGNRVVTKDGKDMTLFFEKGAIESLKIAKKAGCKEAILRQKSPSCGSGKVFDGTFSDTLIEGDGVTAALFKKNKIKVFTEKEI